MPSKVKGGKLLFLEFSIVQIPIHLGVASGDAYSIRLGGFYIVFMTLDQNYTILQEGSRPRLSLPAEASRNVIELGRIALHNEELRRLTLTPKRKNFFRLRKFSSSTFYYLNFLLITLFSRMHSRSNGRHKIFM